MVADVVIVKNFQMLMGSREEMGRENFQSRMDVVALNLLPWWLGYPWSAVMLGPQLCRLPFRVLV